MSKERRGVCGFHAYPHPHLGHRRVLSRRGMVISSFMFKLARGTTECLGHRW